MSALTQSTAGAFMLLALIFVFLRATQIWAGTTPWHKPRHDDKHTIDETGTEFRRLDPPSPPPRRK